MENIQFIGYRLNCFSNSTAVEVKKKKINSYRQWIKTKKDRANIPVKNGDRD